MIKQSASLVSVVIPTYNRAHVIGRAIQSVLNQTYGNFELLIIDDGSTDDTKRIIAGFADERIRYLRHETNKGQNPARNTGVREAKGQYIAFLDSDCEWLPEFIEKMLAVFKKDPSLGAVYARAWGCSRDGDFRGGCQFNLHGHVYKEALIQGYLSYMITIMVKKEIIDLLSPNPLDPNISYGDDDDFCFRVAKICKIGLIAEPLAVIHYDGDIFGGETSICKNLNLIAEGQIKLLEKYKYDILSLCGKSVLASKYFSCAKSCLMAGQIEKGRLSFIESLKLEKSIKTIMVVLISMLPGAIARKSMLNTIRIYDILSRICRLINRLSKRIFRSLYL